MDDISEKIKKLLGDPEGMEKIVGVAKALGESGAGRADGASQELLGGILNNSELKKIFGEDSAKRNALLRGILPYLSEPRRNKLERVLKAADAAGALFNTGRLIG